MAFEEGVATSQGDFIDKLTTFASTNGWTLDEFDNVTNFRAAVSRGNVFVQWKWDNTTSIAGYHSLGFAGGTAPGSQLDDSGNGDIVGAIDTDRRFNAIGNGPFTRHWFFADAATQPYVHYVLEYAPGFFVHGSFGTIDKFGTWTGGEYHGMSIWGSSGLPNSVNHNVLGMDSGHNVRGQAGTIHCESLPSQDPSSKWGLLLRTGETLSTDRAGNPRVRFNGGFRDGFLSHALQGIRANPSNGFVPRVPLHLYYKQNAANPIYMGKLIDVREINGFFLAQEQEFFDGADTWKFFPAHRKATSGVVSGNLFVAYRKT